MSTKKLLDVLNNAPEPKYNKVIQDMRDDGDIHAADMMEAWLSGDKDKFKKSSVKRDDWLAKQSLKDKN